MYGADNAATICTGPVGRHPPSPCRTVSNQTGPPNQCAHEYEPASVPGSQGAPRFLGRLSQQARLPGAMYPWESNQGRGRLRLRPLLELNGEDVRNESRERRKARLEKVLSRCCPEIHFVAESS